MPESLHYYSLVVIAPYEIQLPDHLAVLDAGVNVLNLSAPDIQPILDALTAEGCTIVRHHRLDEHEPVTMPMVLEIGEHDPRKLSDGEESP